MKLQTLEIQRGMEKGVGVSNYAVNINQPLKVFSTLISSHAHFQLMSEAAQPISTATAV